MRRICICYVAHRDLLTGQAPYIVAQTKTLRGRYPFFQPQLSERAKISAHAASIDGRSASKDGRAYLCPVIDRGV